MRKDKSFRGTGCARKMRKNHRSISVQGGEGAFRGVKTAFYSTISAILLNKTGEKTALRTVCRVASGYFGDFRAYFRNNVFASLPSRSQHLAVRWLACRCFAPVALTALPVLLAPLAPPALRSLPRTTTPHRSYCPASPTPPVPLRFPHARTRTAPPPACRRFALVVPPAPLAPAHPRQPWRSHRSAPRIRPHRLAARAPPARRPPRPPCAPSRVRLPHPHPAQNVWKTGAFNMA